MFRAYKIEPNNGSFFIKSVGTENFLIKTSTLAEAKEIEARLVSGKLDIPSPNNESYTLFERMEKHEGKETEIYELKK